MTHVSRSRDGNESGQRQQEWPPATKVIIVGDPRRTARTLISQKETTLDELWVRYWANGGEAQPFEFEAYLHGMYELRAFEHEILALAIDDLATLR